MAHFADIENFFHDAHEIVPLLCAHMRDLLDDIKEKKLKMELAVVVDACEPLEKATYVLEVGGLLVFRAYSVLQALSEAAGRRYYTHVDAMAK